MFEIERYLPVEHRFNESLQEKWDIMTKQFSATAERTGDVLDVTIEFEHTPEDTWQLSEFLADCLKGDYEARELVQGAIYRGLNFGRQVSDAIMDGPLRPISLGHWAKDGENVPSAKLGQSINTDVQLYLSKRAELDSFIGYYMAELGDGTYGLYEHYIEVAAGMMLMLCERQQAEAFFLSETMGGGEIEEV